MLFLNAFLGADECTMPFAPSMTDQNSNMLELSHAMFDELFVTKDVESALDFNKKSAWNYDTLMLADFDNDAEAGNTKWTVDNVTHFIVRRRKLGEYKWVTLLVKPVTKIEDFEFSGTDIATESGEYEYAMFPHFSGTDGDYISITVDVNNTHLVIADPNEVYKTILTDGSCDTTTQAPSETIMTLNDKYPSIVRNSSANYEEIQVSAQFLPDSGDSGECLDYDAAMENDGARILYTRKFKEFLTNGKPKILKNVDGRAWLVYITTPPQDSAADSFKDRTFTFSCTEIGSLHKGIDLYENGFYDLPEEWWYK